MTQKKYLESLEEAAVAHVVAHDRQDPRISPLDATWEDRGKKLP